MKLLLILLCLVSCSQAERRPNSTPSQILHIGDSQSAGYFGKILHDHLQDSERFESIRVFGIGSSSPRHWSALQKEKNGQWLCQRKGRYNQQFPIPLKEKVCSQRMEESAFTHLNKGKKDFVIFQFLGNSMGFNEEYIREKVQLLLSELSPSQECLFLTSPPYFHELEERNELRVKTEKYFVKAIDKRCTLYRGMNRDNMNHFRYQRENYLGDRIHLSQKGAQEFFKQILPYLP